MVVRRYHIVALIVLLFALGLGGYTLLSLRSEPPAIRVSGTADVGGPFALTAHTGERVTEKTFAGQYMLVFFGYTHCPDVCPAELQVISAALDHMGEAAEQVQPLFVTVDPERDTAAHLKEYVAHFHPRLMGLTGTPEEIAAAAKAYKVYYAKVDDEGSSDYLMDHTSIAYLMGPDGKFVQHFSYGTDAEALADKLLAAVKS